METKPTYQAYFKRQLTLPEFGEAAQQKLMQASVLIVGCGGLGSAAAVYLAASGVGTLHLVDFDIVNESNLHRQVFYTINDLEKPKAMVLAKHIQQLAPFTSVSTTNKAVAKETVFELIENVDIVLDCTDSLPIKYLLNDACVLQDKPLVYGSLYKFDGYVASFNVALEQRKRSANLRDVFPEMATNIPNCEAAGTLNAIVGIIALMQANETVKILTKIGKPLLDELLIYNSLENSQLKIKIKSKHTKKQIALIFEEENYDDLTCQVQEATLLITSEELQSLMQTKTEKPIRIISVIEDTQTVLPFQVSEKVPFSNFQDWLEQSHIDEEETLVIVCNKGISSYQATLLAKEKFLKATILSLQNGIENYL